MPSRHTVSTEHRIEDGEQITLKTVQHDDDGRVANFSGPVGGPYEFDGDGDPPEWALEVLYRDVDEAEIKHDWPTTEPDESAE